MNQKHVKLTRRILALSLFAVLLSGCGRKTNAEGVGTTPGADNVQTIYVATQNNFPPFDYSFSVSS